MNIENAKTVVAASAVVLVVGYTIVDGIVVTRTERKKRKEIKKNLKLDLQAIRNATDRVPTLVDEGISHNKNLGQILADLDNEIEFQKIVIRER